MEVDNLKIDIEVKGPKTDKKTLKKVKIKVGRFILLDIKTYPATVVNIINI